MDNYPVIGRNLSPLIRVLGKDLVQYVLNIPDATSMESVDLTSAQETAVGILQEFSHGPGQIESFALDNYFSVTRLSAVIPGAEISLVNSLRNLTGGGVEAATSVNDALADALIAIACDIWPIYLLRPQGESSPTFWMAAPVGAYSHPIMAAAIDAFLADPTLMKLFPEPKEYDDVPDSGGFSKAARYESLIFAPGPSGNLQLVTLLPNLISNAVWRCLMAGRELGLASLTPYITAVVSDLRSLADSQEVRLPALIGLGGVQVPEGSTLELPSGHLRAATDRDRDLFMAGSKSLTSVFETVFPVRIYSIKGRHFGSDLDKLVAEFSAYAPQFTETNRCFEHDRDLMRLSLLLSSPSSEPWLVREVGRFIPIPTSHGGISSWDPSLTSVISHELPLESFDAVREWNELIIDAHVPSLDIGMRRLLSATTGRTDPMDALIDAVICWESLFGTHTETTFRVTGAISKLLEQGELSDREALHRELKEIYETRSRLVHGGSEPRLEELSRKRQRAIEVAAECLRSIYRDRPDLLGLPAAARSARLLLE